MFKKAFWIILILIFILVVVFLVWKINYNKNTQSNKKVEDDGISSLIDPFGDYNQNTTPVKKNEEKKEGGNIEILRFRKKENIPRLRQITKERVSGVFLEPLTKKEIHEINVKNNIFETEWAWKFGENISEIRYILAKNGHIFQTFTNTEINTEILNATIPKVVFADFWDKNNLLVQYLDDDILKTYVINLFPKSDTEIEDEKKKNTYKEGLLNFNGKYLENDILDFKLFKNTKGENKIFYLKKKKDDYGVIGIISGEWGMDRIKVFDSIFKEWNFYVFPNLNIFLINKPSKKTYSLSFKINSKNWIMNKIYGALLSGNALPNHSFTKILYSYLDNNDNYRIFILDLKTKKKIELPTEISTIIDKCVWNRDDTKIYCAVPDIGMRKGELEKWYQGELDTTDSIYAIDSKTGEFENILSSYETNHSFDIIRLNVDYFDKYLYFIDWKTQTPWILRIEKEEQKKENNSGEQEKENNP